MAVAGALLGGLSSEWSSRSGAVVRRVARPMGIFLIFIAVLLLARGAVRGKA